MDAFGPRGVAKIGPGRFAWVFYGKFVREVCVIPAVKLTLFNRSCNSRSICCVYATDLNFVIFMDFLWFVLHLSCGNGAHFKKIGAPAREVSTKKKNCNTSRMGAAFFGNMCFPFGRQATFRNVFLTASHSEKKSFPVKRELPPERCERKSGGGDNYSPGLDSGLLRTPGLVSGLLGVSWA